jgi:hypothetical protein
MPSDGNVTDLIRAKAQMVFCHELHEFARIKFVAQTSLRQAGLEGFRLL